MTLGFESNLLFQGLVVVFIVVFYSPTACRGESPTCLTIYKEGGAPAVFHSPKCPHWKIPNRGFRARATTPTTANGLCQTAAIKGRRKYQEDRILCALDLRIPFPGKAGPRDVVVGMAAVFDGHNGSEASEMASKLLLDYFALHTYFLLDATYSVLSRKLTGKFPNKGGEPIVLHGLSWDEVIRLHKLNFERFKFSGPLDFDENFHFNILKEALLRAIQDIDATFSMEASRRKLDSGSTATITLIADGQILVANIGDSKALLCSEKFETPEEARATLLKFYRDQRRKGSLSSSSPSRIYDLVMESTNGLLRFHVKELTKDHHPSRGDEKIRVEAAGGHVTEWGGVPRVNGQLAVSRSIGDISFKSYGVISAPEVMDWQPLVANDSYLVVASDGIFEKLNVQDVCDVLWEVHNHASSATRLPSYCSFSLADCLINTAFEKGSMDNIAAVVVPLQSTFISHSPLKEQCMSDNTENFVSGLQRQIYALSWSPYTSSAPVQLKQAQPHAPMFNRLLVEGRHSRFGCFHMSENLNAYVDYDALQAPKDELEHDMDELPQALPASLESCSGGFQNLFCDQDLCLPFGMTTNKNQEQCINPESFASFLGLLESIPLHDFDSNNASKEFSSPDSRYVLKKRFGRGSYGEVWLAFHWNCYQGSNASSWIRDDENMTKSGVHINEYTSDLASNASSVDYDAKFSDNFYILKRIMFERGPAVYLSGLREKHFGELFLNACKSLESFTSTQASSARLKSSQLEISEEGLKHIARYIESFESRYNDIWLVFHHEGVSLSKLMYSVEEAENTASDEKVEEARHVQMLHPSKWWIWLKTTDAGKEEMRSIIWQLLLALKSCHDRNITHRDVKPENMVICFEDQKTGRCLKGLPSGDQNFKTKMYLDHCCLRIIDFGSALDKFTMKQLYGSTGPSRAEQTQEYAPPEAILNNSWYRGPTSMNLKYDMWSVGVVMLEMTLGMPNVFQISSVTRALLDKHIEGWNANLKELAYKLRSFMELCILIPGSSLKRGRTGAKQDIISLASWKCSEEFFSQQIKDRDPLEIGFPNVWALRLVRHLLLWDPEDRLSVDDALQHPYFQPPPSS